MHVRVLDRDHGQRVIGPDGAGRRVQVRVLRAAPDRFLAKRVFQRGFRGPDFGGHGVGVVGVEWIGGGAWCCWKLLRKSFVVILAGS